MAKVALGTITAMFGTSQIAASGIAQSFWSLSALIGVAMVADWMIRAFFYRARYRGEVWKPFKLV